MLSLIPRQTVKRLLAERSLYQFVLQAWKILEPTTEFVPGWHIEAVCTHLEAVSEGLIRNLLIEIPPRSSKSTIISVLWPAWEWIRNPSRRFLTGSYAMNLAIRDALRTRRVITSPWYTQRWGQRFKLTGDQNVKSRYENNATGYRIALSVSAGTTGEGGDITLIDDPHNVMEAESLVQRQNTVRWHDEAFYNRLNNAKTGSRVVVGQRVHSDDLIGHLKKQGGWDVLTVPEEFEAAHRCTTSIGWTDPRQADGELMRPERFGPEQVVEAKKKLGSYAYAAQHQQRPVPREGALFKRQWWIRYHWMTDHYVVSGTGAQVFPHRCKRLAVMDPAGGTSEGADNTAIAIWDITSDRKALLRHAFKDRIPVELIPRKLKELCDTFRPLYALVEGAFLQSHIVKECRKLPGMPAIRSVDPGGKNKFLRAVPAIVKAEAGELFIPADNQPGFDWLADWLAEHEQFTGNDDLHDDQVDCTAYMALDMQSVMQAGAVPIAVGEKYQ